MFIAYIILFMFSGIFIEKVKCAFSLLYAAITVTVMHLCFGIVNSLLSVCCISVPMKSLQSTGLIFMWGGSIFSLAMSVFCYVMIEKYFRSDETDGTKYALMILSPMLLIFLTTEYINSSIYGNTVTTDNNGKILLDTNSKR